MDRAIYKQKIIDIVTEMKSRLTDPNNTATEDFAEGFTLALEAAGITSSLSFVDELPDEGVENILYVDRLLLRFAIWQDDDWDFFSSGVAQIQVDWNQTDNTAVDFIKNKPTIPESQIQSDWNQTDNTQVDFIKNKPTTLPPSAHTQLDLTIELTETYTGNLSGATTQKQANDILDSLVGGAVALIRLSDYISADRKSYLAFAPTGSQETDAVWTITKRVGSDDGTIVSNVRYFNKRWTERGLL